MLKKGFIFLICLLALSTENATAHHTTQQEFRAISRVASLCSNCSGKIKIMIIYEKDLAVSVKDTASIVKYAKNNGIFNISTSSDITDNILDSNLVIMAHGVSIEHMQEVVAKTKGKKIITVSSDIQCIDANACMLGVDVSDSIKIFLNKDILKKTNIKFSDDILLLTS